MTYDEFDDRYTNDFALFEAHMEYIMENCHGERIICDGDTLIEAAEEGYLYEDFRDDYLTRTFQWEPQF